jgi:SAM-dependent methyltransferase
MDYNTDYIRINKDAWNKRTEVHFDSEFYDNASFLAGKNTNKSIEMPLLGDVKDKSLLHLQCHFGQDTLSLARLGAKAVGVDLSDRALQKAEILRDQLNLDTRFICCDLYDLPLHLDEQFDIVFSSYGTIGWLPDIKKWAHLVAKYLKPGGKFVFAEFHPVVWMYDDDFEAVTYRYFNDGPIVESLNGSYTDPNADIHYTSIFWNYGLAEVMGGLIEAGLQIKVFKEFDYSPHDCFRGTIEFAPEKYRIEKLGDKIPMVYALSAEKPIN